MSEIKKLTEDNFNDEISESMPLVIDFYADWCGPCKMMGPIFDEAVNKYDGKVRFAKVNIDEQRKLAISNKVMSIPTFLFFKDGELKDRHTGAMDEPTLHGKLDELL